MLKRVVTSLIGLLILFAILASNSIIVFGIAVGVFVAGMLWEMYTTLKSHPAVIIVGYISALFISAGIFTSHDKAALMASVMLFLFAAVLLHEKVLFKDIAAAFLCTVFISYFMQAITMQMISFGIAGALFIFLCAWTTDTGAYFFGRSLGRHKLIPKVSPKKTVEGSLGGILCCVLCNIIYVLILNFVFNIETFKLNILGITELVIFAAAASVIAQIGDLAASAIKRDFGVKDFGKIFPGHGGILDRFDSVVFLAPFVFYFFRLMSMV